MKDTTSNTYLDSLGILLSGTCMVHCLALPVLITLFPIIEGTLMEEQQFHALFLLLVLPTSATALALGCRRHRDWITGTVGTVGMAILILAATWGHDWLGPDGERITTMLGGAVLACGHILNFRRCHELDCDHDENRPERSATG